VVYYLVELVIIRVSIFRSSVWNDVDADEKKDIDFSKADDGEFWMSFDDWLMNFTEMQICHLSPDASSTSESVRRIRLHNLSDTLCGSMYSG
jgi:hypothetical protein